MHKWGKFIEKEEKIFLSYEKRKNNNLHDHNFLEKLLHLRQN